MEPSLKYTVYRCYFPVKLGLLGIFAVISYQVGDSIRKAYWHCTFFARAYIKYGKSVDWLVSRVVAGFMKKSEKEEERNK